MSHTKNDNSCCCTALVIPLDIKWEEKTWRCKYFQDEEGVDELKCKICNQYFISVHNKKEHMFGRQHLMAITSEYLIIMT